MSRVPREVNRIDGTVEGECTYLPSAAMLVAVERCEVVTASGGSATPVSSCSTSGQNYSHVLLNKAARCTDYRETGLLEVRLELPMRGM